MHPRYLNEVGPGKKYFRKTFILICLFIPYLMIAQTPATGTGDKITLSTERRVKSPFDNTGFIITNEIQQWDPKQTAIIICDMWNQHWCKGATSRVAEMTPRLNEVLMAARSKGAERLYELL
jgi:hypothetical protein